MTRNFDIENQINKRIKQVRKQFAQRKETKQDMANYYVTKFNYHVNKETKNQEEKEKQFQKAKNSLQAINKYNLIKF